MNKLAEQHEALGHYIDALLTRGDLAADADGPRPAGAAAPIIELRRVGFPEGHAAREDRSPYRYLVVLQGPSIALACDEIGAVITEDSGDVQWRETRATRPWLAGMLRECKCAVIDLSTAFDEPAGAAH